jgi:effector-binding domain-containing protein
MKGIFLYNIDPTNQKPIEMKALKITGIVLLLIVVVVGILSFMSPTHVHMERHVIIDAPSDFIMSHVSSFEQMNQWSPWTKLDPDMTSEITGEDGTISALYSWSGNEDVGQGERSITEISEGKVVTHMHFMTPWEGHADATVLVNANEAGGSDVSWSYDADSPRPMNMMNLFMKMDDFIGPDYEQGLENLKNMVAENKANRSEFDGYTITRIDLVPRTYVGVRDTVKWEAMSEFYTNHLGKIFAACTKAELPINGKPSGVYFSWDQAGQQAEMMAAVPIEGESPLKQYEAFKVAGPALMVECRGPYEESGKAHEAIEKYMEWHGLSMSGPAIEEYIVQPSMVSDQSEILTNIYYPI